MVDDLIYEFVPEIGESYNITGIVDYSYGSFRIEPRYSSDISISSTSQEDVLNINFNLYNFPNPFNPSTIIYFETTSLRQGYSGQAELTENTELIIYNLKGQKVKEFSDIRNQTSVIWNGTNDKNQPVSSGIYFYKLKAGEYTSTKKMILMK